MVCCDLACLIQASVQNEVYVMNVKKIVGKYHRSLFLNPVIAAILAYIVLSANKILPWIIGLFSEQTATRMRESVELISVYGVALGTLFVFLVVGGLFAMDLPTHLQNYREKIRKSKLATQLKVCRKFSQ